MADDTKPKREQPSGLSERELQILVERELTDAVHYLDEELAPERAESTNYYLGRPLGNEEEGRSQIVMTEVRDVVSGLMPSLMRIFFGGERVVEFAPRGPDDILLADQQTEYINYILSVDNDGFLTIYSAFKDALVRKLGVIKYWVEEQTRVSREEFSGLDDAALTVLGQEEGLTVLHAEERGAGEAGPLYDVTVERRHTEKRIRIAAVPPEEFLIDRNATSLETATVVAHRRELPIGDLVAMGFDYDEILAKVGTTAADEDDLSESEEALARKPERAVAADEATIDPMMRKVLFTEAYVRADVDGDQQPERRRVYTVGSSYQIIAPVGATEESERVDDEVPFALFGPDPEPHTVIGTCPADRVKDLQRIKTAVVRNILDSLAQSIHPDTWAVKGRVEIGDLMNKEMGRIVRVDAPGMFGENVKPFVGKEAFPLLEYFDEIKQARTGISKAAQGLDADALQSSTKAAVAATITASQQQVELIARIFAETGMKRLMRGLLRLVCRHQNQPRMIRLRGQWVTVDPRSWNADMDVVVNVALGTGSPEEKIGLLMQVLLKQEQYLQTLGPDNPLVGVPELRHTLEQLLRLGGYRDVARFFKPIPADWTPPQPQQPPPDPATMVAQAEVQRIQAEIQMKQMELQLKAEEMRQKNDLERDKAAHEFALKERELELKHQVEIRDAELRAAVQQHRTTTMAEAAAQAPAAPAGGAA